jgi:hypothetical protein
MVGGFLLPHNLPFRMFIVPMTVQAPILTQAVSAMPAALKRSLPALPADIQQALLPFSTLMTEKKLNWTTQNAAKNLAALDALNPAELSQTLINRLNSLPGMEALKTVFLAEQAQVTHPRLNQWAKQAQQWLQKPHVAYKLRGLVLKVLIDSVNGIVSALTRLGRKLTVMASDLMEHMFEQAGQRGKALASRLMDSDAQAHPVSQQFKAIQLAGEKGKALLANLRQHLAKDHPQFDDAGVQQAFDDVKRVHEAERRSLRTDDLALRWLTKRPGEPGYLTRPGAASN